MDKNACRVALFFIAMWIVPLAGDSTVRTDSVASDSFKPLVGDLASNFASDREKDFVKDVKKVVDEIIDKKDDKKKDSDKKDDRAKDRKEELVDIRKGRFYAALGEFLNEPLFKKKMTIKTAGISTYSTLQLLAKEAGTHFLIDSDVRGDVSRLVATDNSIAAILQQVLDGHNPPLALVPVEGTWRVIDRKKAELLIVTLEAKKNFFEMCDEHLEIKNAKWNDALKKSMEEIWKGIIAPIKDLPVFLVFEDSTSQLFFRAPRAQTESFKEVIAALDRPMPQVRLDMRVVFADKHFEYGFGVNWSGLYDRRSRVGRFGLAGLGLGQVDSSEPSAFSQLLGWALNAIPVNLASRPDFKTLTFPIIFGGKALEKGRLNLLLNAAEHNNQIKTVLKPTLLVNNQETSEILVGEQFPHQVKMQEAVQSGVVNSTTTSYKDVGTKIQVRPLVVLDSETILLDVFLEHSLISKQKTFLNSGSDDARGNYNYTIATSRTKNKIGLRSGQTTLIGGLTVNMYEESESGIPGLSEIPVLGLLFKGKSKILVEKQLMVFITPTLVSDAG